MYIKELIKVGFIGLAVATMAPTMAPAQDLRVLSGNTSRALAVSINDAVVVESDTPFAELSVANPQIADIATLSDRTIYVLGKAPGRTTVTLLGPDGRLITNVQVQVTPDVSEFKERLAQVMPNEKIEVRTANDGIVLSGVVSSIQKLDRALDLAQRYAPGAVSNLMSVGGTQQVMLKVRFAEMSRSVGKEISASLGIQTLGTRLFGEGGSGALVDGPGTVTTDANGAFSVGLLTGSISAQIAIEALESKGLVRTLAEPNLVALSGQEAAFLAGGEVPIPVVDDDGVGIEYRAFGVELTFTPTVVDGDVINLALETAVSSVDDTNSIVTGAIEVPGFNKRASSTTVELRDGESFSIAGLLQDDFTSGAGQVPWLGDLPILGALFRSSNFQRSQTELVIIVTAHLVNPILGDAYVLPTDRVLPPTEADLFLNGKVGRTTRRASGAAGEVARQDFSGSYGYVLE